jgi:hypothetical protein
VYAYILCDLTISRICADESPIFRRGVTVFENSGALISTFRSCQDVVTVLGAYFDIMAHRHLWNDTGAQERVRIRGLPPLVPRFQAKSIVSCGVEICQCICITSVNPDDKVYKITTVCEINTSRRYGDDNSQESS